MSWKEREKKMGEDNKWDEQTKKYLQAAMPIEGPLLLLYAALWQVKEVSSRGLSNVSSRWLVV